MSSDSSHQQSYKAAEANVQVDQEKTNQLIGKGKEATDSLNNNAQTAKDSAWSSAQAAKDKTAETAQSGNEKAQDSKDRSAGSCVSEKAPDSKDQSESYMSDKAQDAKEKSCGSAEAVKEKASGLTQGGGEMAQSGIEETGGGGVLQKTGEKARSVAQGATDAVKNAFGMNDLAE